MEQRSTSLAKYHSTVPAELTPGQLYLDRIRPEWRDRRLVERVQKLLPVDPSSAAQRLLNAAFHDLRSKVRVLGVDLADEVARLYKLPPVKDDDGLEDYSSARLIDLAHRMGLLTRAEARQHKNW